VLISSDADLLPTGPIAATEVKDLILRHVFDGREGAKGGQNESRERASSMLSATS
jgi:hypothetical protein